LHAAKIDEVEPDARRRRHDEIDIARRILFAACDRSKHPDPRDPTRLKGGAEAL
jgi:hypothetical protein